MSGRLSLQEIETILDLLDKGLPISRIAAITGRNINTISRLKNENYTADRLTKMAENAETEKERWLQKYWRWKDPKDQHAIRPGAKKKKKKSNFRTPYNH